MKCPYCYKLNRFKVQKKKGSRIVYYCVFCKSEVPKVFIESPETPLTKIGMIGYPGHGKTIFKLSLLYQLRALPNYWDSFYFETLDDTTHREMYYEVPELEHGRMFMRTKAIYPLPTFIRLNSIPYFNTQFVSLFDTGGRLFENLDVMTRRGRYLAHCDVIFFFISLTEKDLIGNWNMKIMKLLDRYLNVIYSRYGVNTKKKQSIIFILTKADELLKLNGEINLSNELKQNLANGAIEHYRHFDENKLNEIENNSAEVENWLRSNNCNSFINLANSHFKNISFAITSAIGNSPINGKLEKELSLKDPRCVLDPLLWAMHVSN